MGQKLLTLSTLQQITNIHEDGFNEITKRMQTTLTGLFLHGKKRGGRGRAMDVSHNLDTNFVGGNLQISIFQKVGIDFLNAFDLYHCPSQLACIAGGFCWWARGKAR